MVLYARASTAQFFKFCPSGINSIKELNCPIEVISELCKESEVRMLVHPLTSHSLREKDCSVFCIIKDMQFNKDDSMWDVVSTSGDHFYLLV